MQVVPNADIPESQEQAEGAGLLEGFTFCGLLSLIDPPRDAVRSLCPCAAQIWFL